MSSTLYISNMNSVRSNKLNLKYQRCVPCSLSDYKDIGREYFANFANKTKPLKQFKLNFYIYFEISA